MSNAQFLIYLAVMAGVTYLVRMLPLVLFRRRIKNRFILSFLHYIPIAVLTVMTVPAVFYASSSWISALAGFVVALIFAYLEKSLVQVAAFSCIGVFIAEMLIKYL
ncbi:MAG: AzlD domain-containing protein [Ruminococcaceae bacterium]|nr:AzlD domain-containing protein [Oscillospiraceae bacterium]